MDVKQKIGKLSEFDGNINQPLNFLTITFFFADFWKKISKTSQFTVWWTQNHFKYFFENYWKHQFLKLGSNFARVFPMTKEAIYSFGSWWLGLQKMNFKGTLWLDLRQNKESVQILSQILWFSKFPKRPYKNGT